LTNCIWREKFKGVSFPHFREDRAITKDSDYLQNIDNQAKVYDLEKQIDQLVYDLYNPPRGDCNCGGKKVKPTGQNYLEKARGYMIRL